MFKLKNSLITRVKNSFLMIIFVFVFFALNGCSAAQIAPVCDFLESTLENVCFESEDSTVIIYLGGKYVNFKNGNEVQHFKLEFGFGGEITLGIENNFIEMDCSYFDDNIIKFEILEEDVGKIFPSDVTILEFKRRTLTAAETEQIKEEYKTQQEETNRYSPKNPVEALAKYGPNGHQLVSRIKPEEFKQLNPREVLDDLKNEAYIELPHDTVFETKGKDKKELINYVYVPHKEYCESYIFYNCLTTNGREKFKPLIEKYTIFNNLRTELLANNQDANAYSAIAFNRQ